MKTAIKTDLQNFTFEARREFKAPVSMVWRAFTEAGLLDQWWAPKPWKCETKQMDFRIGGTWLYDMVGPEGERHGGIQIFKEIVFENYFSGIDAFADESGEIKSDLPVANWKNSFISTENGTLVISFTKYPDQKSLETVLQMGLSEGLSMAQDNLEAVLEGMTQ